MRAGADNPARAAAGSPGDWLGHPKALAFLFLTGMWEVAALAGMRTILVFHLIKDAGLPTAAAVQIFGVSTAASFVMSFVGGALADRVLGVSRAILLGALVMAIGHFALAAPALLFPSLALIAVGSGMFRPTLIAQVWRLYDENDPRTGDALLRYKLGCNLGGIFGPLACGALYEFQGWTHAVVFCGAGMLVAAGIYAGSARFRPKDPPRRPRTTLREAAPGFRMSVPALAVLGLVFLGGSLHWTAANQQGGTLAVWTLENLNRSVSLFGWSFTIPAGWFQTINPILILVFAPLISWFWSRNPAASPARTEMRRMVLGSALLALSYLVLAWAALQAGDQKVHWAWLVLATAPLVLGEIYLDAMGQAFFCRHAPRGYLSTFLSLWLVTSTVGYLAAGWIAALWGRIPTATFFGLSAVVALASCAVIALSRALRTKDLDA